MGTSHAVARSASTHRVDSEQSASHQISVADNDVLSDRQGGPEQVLQLVEQRAPNGFTRIEDVTSDDELDSIALQYRKTAGFEIEALNTQPSWEVAKPA
jgi:hypothetical protein